MLYVIVSVCCILAVCVAVYPQTALDLTPPVKQLDLPGGALALQPADKTLIVVGDAATDPEKYAAQRLQELIARRCKVSLAIFAESACPAEARPLILMGQTSTNHRLQQLWERRRLRLWEGTPPQDAYAIEVLKEESTVVVCGSNPRAVIYGAQTLFRLLSAGTDQLAVPVVSVRDWPSIPWRGRPYTSVQAHLEPGVMDAYLWAGLNFIDVRAGAFGYAPDAKLDRDAIGRCILEAHRRGLFIFGTVSCGIPPEKFDGALRVFRELIELGVDGLWISFDDPGGGKNTTELAARVVELGKERGMTGRAIATTPPTGSYQTIETDFNREMVKIPGMEQATWFFTRNPCKEDLAAAQRLGLKSLPAWWHNWPRTEGGFTHGSYGGTSFRPAAKPSYMEVPPLTWGWHTPNYDKLRDAPANTDTAMMWGGWQPEYTCAVLGLWAWDPERHDFIKTRRAIYQTVYGASNVDRMVRLDDALHELKARFLLPERAADPNLNFPARLRPTAKPDEVAKLLQELATLRAEVAASAPGESLLTPERLQAQFLEPMAAELAAAKVLATADRPEAWWPAHEVAVLAKLAANDTKGVEQLCAQARPRIEQELAALKQGLADLLTLDSYIKLWSDRAAGGEGYWRAELDRRAKALAKRLADRRTEGLDIDAMTAPLATPPAAGTLLGTVTPRQLASSPISSQGKWLTGLYPPDNPQAFVMSFPGRTASTPGGFCQVTFSLKRPRCQGKLHLQLFLTDEYDSDIWRGYRFYQLLHGTDLLWEEDIALTRRGGKEWSSVDISKIGAEGEEVALTLRLLDKRSVSNYATTIFIGPLSLVDVP